MQSIPYTPDIVLRNTEQLPRGSGCRYLEVITSHIPGEYIAVCWRRTIPKADIVIDFKPDFDEVSALLERADDDT